MSRQEGRSTYSMQWQDRERFYHLFMPEGAPTSPMPLVMFLHGLDSSASALSTFDRLGDRFGFLSVYPDAVQEDDNAFNAGGSRNREIDDVGFLNRIMDDLIAGRLVDPTRIYVAGHSNGGSMAYRLALESGERLAAIGVSAGLAIDAVAKELPHRPLPLMHVHGTSDTCIPFDGSAGCRSVPDLMTWWSRSQEGADNPTVEHYPHVDEAGPRFERHEYATEGGEVLLIKAIGGSHDWFSGNAGFDIDTAAEMWRFFSAHALSGAASTQVTERRGESSLRFALRNQVANRDADGRFVWRTEQELTEVHAWELVVVICDMWDQNWSRAANKRVDELAPRIDQFARLMRDAGATIIHAPSETMNAYEHHPARKRAVDVPESRLPEAREITFPRLPIDDSDGGSDSNDGSERVHTRTWSRQTEAIHIDADADYITDDGHCVYSIMETVGARLLLLCGVHANMCILDRSFGVRNLVGRGVSVVLLRDLTDALYNPAMAPYVSHDQGTELMIGYIEKFWCPTTTAADVTHEVQN